MEGLGENSGKNTEFTEQNTGFAHLIGGSDTFGPIWSIRSKGGIPLLLG